MEIKFGVRWFDTLPSTHEWVKGPGRDVAPFVMVLARAQEAGRGQRGNSWESAPGRNLTFTFRYTPVGIRPSEQFAISEAVALAVAEMLGDYGIEASVKWPNDIYVAGRKICGILIDHAVSGSREIESTVVSAGINVNQERFLSDAPNPVSMCQCTGREYPLEEVLTTLQRHLAARIPQSGSGEGRQSLHRDYMERLWRNDGAYHPFRIAASGERRMARIGDVAPHGPITLRFEEGTAREFAFKEIEFLGE